MKEEVGEYRGDGQKWKLDFSARNLQLWPHFKLVTHSDIASFEPG